MYQSPAPETETISSARISGGPTNSRLKFWSFPFTTFLSRMSTPRRSQVINKFDFGHKRCGNLSRIDSSHSRRDSSGKFRWAEKLEFLVPKLIKGNELNINFTFKIIKKLAAFLSFCFIQICHKFPQFCQIWREYVHFGQWIWAKCGK